LHPYSFSSMDAAADKIDHKAHDAEEDEEAAPSPPVVVCSPRTTP
jgi:hypothetical protein